jgi:hypothetical protein
LDIIHAFLPREANGYRIEEAWDTLGMRATRSDDTILEGAFVPDRYITRKIPARALDPFLLALFGSFLPPLSAVYYGLAQRAADLAIASACRKTSLGLTRTMAYHPEVQHLAAEMTISSKPWAPTSSESPLTGPMPWTASGVSSCSRSNTAPTRPSEVVDLAMTMSGGVGM